MGASALLFAPAPVGATIVRFDLFLRSLSRASSFECFDLLTVVPGLALGDLNKCIDELRDPCAYADFGELSEEERISSGTIPSATEVVLVDGGVLKGCSTVAAAGSIVRSDTTAATLVGGGTDGIGASLFSVLLVGVRTGNFPSPRLVDTIGGSSTALPMNGLALAPALVPVFSGSSTAGPGIRVALLLSAINFAASSNGDLLVLVAGSDCVAVSVAWKVAVCEDAIVPAA